MSRYIFATSIVGVSALGTAIAIGWIQLWYWLSGGQVWGAAVSIGGVLFAIWLGIVWSMKDD